MRELTVATGMTKDPVTVAPDTEFKDIVEILAKYSISAVPVVGRDGVPIRVVSEADLIRKQEMAAPPSVIAGRQARDRWHKAGAERALDLMTVPVRAVEASESVSFAARELNRRRVRRLFVIDHSRLVGVVSRRDLLKVVSAFGRGDPRGHRAEGVSARALGGLPRCHGLGGSRCRDFDWSAGPAQ